MAKKKKSTAKLTLSGYSSYYVFCTSPMKCPLCGITVPANTEHRCEKKA